MKKGIAMWTMSKVVMFIFLVLVFATVILYSHVLYQKVAADAAQSVTLQLKSTLTAVISSDALDTSLTVSLPTKIPEDTAEVYESAETPHRKYTIVTKKESDPSKGGEYITFAITFDEIKSGEDPSTKSYIAASWLLLPTFDTNLKFDLGPSDYFYSTGSKTLYIIQKVTNPTSSESVIYFRTCDIAGTECDGIEP